MWAAAFRVLTPPPPPLSAVGAASQAAGVERGEKLPVQFYYRSIVVL